MNQLIDLISQPWHWSVSGALIALTMFFLLWAGGEFGVSNNLRTMCSIGGAGKNVDFFKFDWKKQIWNLVFIAGAIAGGYIASHYLASDDPVQVSQSTIQFLESKGINYPATMAEGAGFVPAEIYHSWTWESFIFLIVGGLLIGFGTRYAGGYTSGHAISGLSNLQLPSLIAVIGFFIGGLIMAWAILPSLLPIF